MTKSSSLPESASAANPKPTKTIVLVGGDKGGVGKSTVARTLAEFFEREKVSFIAFDGDDTNPTFSRFWPQSERLTTKTAKGFEVLLNNLEAEVAVQLVDLGAGTSFVLNQFEEQSGFLDVAKEHGARVTFVFVLAPGGDSIGLLKNLSDRYGNRMNYVVAKNNANPGTWELWERSKTRLRVLGDFGGIEIDIPILDAVAFTAAGNRNLTWTQAVKDKGALTLAERSYVFRWLQKLTEQFAKAQGLLR